MELYPYTSHLTPEKNPRAKYHISKNGSVALCGFSHGSYTSQLISDEIDKAWLVQPDPDNWVCKKCRKRAEEILNNPWFEKWIVLPEPMTVKEIRLYFIDDDNIAETADEAWSKFLGVSLRKEAYEKNGCRAVQIDEKITKLLKKAFDEE